MTANFERKDRVSLAYRTEAQSLRVAFDGPITEHFEPEVELAALAPLLSKGPARIVLDLGGVSRINSAGIRLWIKFLGQLQNAHTVSFSMLPEAFVDLVPISPFILGKLPCEIEAFQVPFSCGECGRTETVIAQVADVERGGKWKGAHERPCSECGGKIQLDTVEEYFGFVALTEPESEE